MNNVIFCNMAWYHVSHGESNNLHPTGGMLRTTTRHSQCSPFEIILKSIEFYLQWTLRRFTWFHRSTCSNSLVRSSFSLGQGLATAERSTSPAAAEQCTRFRSQSAGSSHHVMPGLWPEYRWSPGRRPEGMAKGQGPLALVIDLLVTIVTSGCYVLLSNHAGPKICWHMTAIDRYWQHLDVFGDRTAANLQAPSRTSPW